MKLNHDCIRDILLYVEENIPFGGSVILNESLISGYEDGTVAYCASKLIEAGYIDGSSQRYMVGSYMIQLTSLTWNGHALLDNIRSESTFNKAKTKIIETVGSASIQILSEVASAVAIASLGLNK